VLASKASKPVARRPGNRPRHDHNLDILRDAGTKRRCIAIFRHLQTPAQGAPERQWSRSLAKSVEINE